MSEYRRGRPSSFGILAELAYVRPTDARRAQEEFLTAALRFVLAENPRVATRVLRRSGVLPSEDRTQIIEVVHQHRAACGIVDLQVRTADGVYWIEAKVSSPATAEQVRRYHHGLAMAARAGHAKERKLALLLSSWTRVQSDAARAISQLDVIVISWQAVFDALQEATVRGRHGVHVRDLTGLMRREGVAMSGEITPKRLRQMRAALELDERLRAGLLDALNDLNGEAGYRARRQRAGGPMYWQIGYLERTRPTSGVYPWMYNREWIPDGVDDQGDLPVLALWLYRCDWNRAHPPKPWTAIEPKDSQNNPAHVCAPLSAILKLSKSRDPREAFAKAIRPFLRTQ